MNQLGPFLALLALAAVVLAGFGALVGWWNAETRRIRRGLRKVLGEEPHALIVAAGRGRGAGFNFTSGVMAVAWDSGAWCLLYRIDELMGVELLVDGRVAARTWRGEARRPLETLDGVERQVALRLIFDDPHHPDFGLELWSAADASRRSGATAADAVEEGNRWLARTESLFRRKPAGAPVRPMSAPEPMRAPEPERAAGAAPPAPALAATAAAGAAPQELPFAADAPWDEDEDDEALL